MVTTKDENVYLQINPGCIIRLKFNDGLSGEIDLNLNLTGQFSSRWKTFGISFSLSSDTMPYHGILALISSTNSFGEKSAKNSILLMCKILKPIDNEKRWCFFYWNRGYVFNAYNKLNIVIYYHSVVLVMQYAAKNRKTDISTMVNTLKKPIYWFFRSLTPLTQWCWACPGKGQNIHGWGRPHQPEWACRPICGITEPFRKIHPHPRSKKR